MKNLYNIIVDVEWCVVISGWLELEKVDWLYSDGAYNLLTVFAKVNVVNTGGGNVFVWFPCICAHDDS